MAVADKSVDEVVKLFASGHTACAGCGQASAARLLLETLGANCILTCATGCLEVFTSRHPTSAWGVPWIHSLFENSSAVASGVEAALRALGKADQGTQVVAMGGDGATLDIGFGALSGMFERGHDVLYVCFDNEAYMNTGVQRSSSTPMGAMTTTSPPGKLSLGKERPKKDLPRIAAAHGIPYVASASIGFFADYRRKLRKAMGIRGSKYLQVHASCPPGWGYEDWATVKVAKLAVETGMYPLVEFENGELSGVRKITPVPVEEYFRLQRRFAHLFRSEEGKAQLTKLQELADQQIARYGLRRE